MLGPLDPATSAVPVDQLTALTSVVSASGQTVSLRAATSGDVVGLQLGASFPGYDQAVEGGPHELEQWWMVSNIDNQHLVWGLAPAAITGVDVYLDGGGVVSGPTFPIASDPASVAFLVVLPELAQIEGLAGVAGEEVRLAGAEVATSLERISEPSPHLLEWTAFVPMVQH
jgi:hypothetical protein